MPCARTRVVLVTYEFDYAPFSGNGILAQNVATGLLRVEDTAVLVVCCRPAPCFIAASPQCEHERLERAPVDLTEDMGWRRLDRSGAAWSHFAGGASTDRVRAFAPDVALIVDWHGAAVWRALGGATVCPALYLNFRVYSATAAPDEAAWYDARETDALANSSAALALSRPDAAALERLAPSTWRDAGRTVDVLLPPLRADLHELANVPPPPENTHPAGHDGRLYLACVVRLSAEKNPKLFVEVIEKISDQLDALGVTPLLAGAAADADYAAELRARLIRAAPGALVHEDFVGPQELARLMRSCRLNFHPCEYDACEHRRGPSDAQHARAAPARAAHPHPHAARADGMTVIEAAAFGAPSVVNGGGTVGALELLTPDGVIEADLRGGADAAAALVLGALRDPARLRATGAEAQRRALAWGVEAHGDKLREHMMPLIPGNQGHPTHQAAAGASDAGNGCSSAPRYSLSAGLSR